MSMFWEILIAIVAGVYSGCFTGLIPGIHVNLISAIVVGSLFGLSTIEPFYVVVFIMSLALTHSFLDSIPSVYLGAPDPGMEVAILPAHQLFLQGKGHLAVLLTLAGSYFSLLFSLLFAPLVYLILEPLSQFLSPYIGQLLLGLVFLLFLLSKKLVNVIFFVLSGLLGFLSFELSMEQVLLPLLSGLFGVSTLLISFISPSVNIKQVLRKKYVLSNYTNIERVGLLATLTGFIASFLPGFGSSQGAIFSSLALKEKSPQNYLLLVGGINTVNFTLSLLTFYLLSKARNGAVASMSTIFTLELSHFLLLTPLLLVVGSVSVLLGIFLSKQAAQLMSKIPYRQTILGVVIFIVVLVIIFTGWKGLLLLAVATSLGILAQRYQAQKNMLLGCLLLPVIFYLW